MSAQVFKPWARGNLLSPGSWGAPKVDWTHPLTNGLIGCWLPGVSLGNDLTGHADLTLTSLSGASGNGVNWQALQQEGPGLNSLKNGGFGFYDLSATAPAIFKNWTVGFSLYWRGWIGPSADTPPQNTDYIGIAYDNAADPPFTLVNIQTGGATNTFQASWNSAGTGGNTSTTAVSSLAINSVGATFAVGGSGILYKSGVSVSSASFGASAPNSSVTSTIDIGNYHSLSLARFSNSSTLLGCAWNRALSSDEMALLDANPYCFLLPAEGEMPALFISGGGNVFNLPAAEGTYAFTGETQVLGIGLPATRGIYTFTGETQGLGVGLPASQGSYTFTGEAQAFTRGKGLSAVQGSYTFTGEAQSFQRGINILPVRGVYTFTGEPQSTNAARTVSAVHGTYTFTGESQNLLRGRTLIAAEGTYTFTGETVTLTKTGATFYVLTAQDGTYVFLGKNQTLIGPAGGGGKTYREGYDALMKEKERLPSVSDQIRKAAAVISSLGGHARRDALSPKERSNIASIAAKARWK